LAVTGGGPEYDLFGRIPYYPVDKLDEWVAARLSRRRSTSDRGVSDGQKPGYPHPPLGRKGAPLESEPYQTRNKTAGSSSAHDEGQSGGPDQDGDPASTPAGSIHSP